MVDQDENGNNSFIDWTISDDNPWNQQTLISLSTYQERIILPAKKNTTGLLLIDH